jgi:hypothetical protein
LWERSCKGGSDDTVNVWRSRAEDERTSLGVSIVSQHSERPTGREQSHGVGDKVVGDKLPRTFCFATSHVAA